MKQQKNPRLIINVITSLLFLVVAYFGYTTFRNEVEVVATPQTSSQGERDPLVTSLEVARTVRDLRTLDAAVQTSSSLLRSPAFATLRDLSGPVPTGVEVGRQYPFWKTDWRLGYEEAERRAIQQLSQSFAPVSAPVISQPPAQNPLNTPAQPSSPEEEEEDSDVL